jgi:esterase/lipase superfamily enzyme
MELLVFGHAGERVLVFPTRAGRFFDYEDWGLVAAAGGRIAAGQVQLYCLDSVDAESFYCPWRCPADRVRRHEAYEGYVLDEVVPLTRRLNPHPVLAAHGCSMGAYHAVNLATRHPHAVGRVVALSGRYDLTAAVGPFRDLLDGHYDLGVYYHTPAHFLPGLSDEGLLGPLRRAGVTLAVGEADPFLGSNRLLSEALRGKGVDHALHVWPGRAHKPAAWRPMVAEYL